MLCVPIPVVWVTAECFLWIEGGGGQAHRHFDDKSEVNRGGRQGERHLLQQAEKTMEDVADVARRQHIDLGYKEFLYKCTT